MVGQVTSGELSLLEREMPSSSHWSLWSSFDSCSQKFYQWHQQTCGVHSAPCPNLDSLGLGGPFSWLLPGLSCESDSSYCVRTPTPCQS